MGVVPARAGMSPYPDCSDIYNHGGPRASGDEPPHRRTAEHVKEWSPRERG